jgi:4-diphosphocytidyl-2-C-methyl-D-erythritol kinase
MTELTIQAPGKINLHLRVKGRLPGGYHDLESIFLALNFGDTLVFTLLDEPETVDIQVSSPGFPLPKENSVYAAVLLFRAETGFNRGLRVRMENRMPLGGGRGGGSSDAASTLLALNRLSGAGLSAGRLERMAGKLGSDTPFFLSGGAAWVSGRGERVEPLPVPAGLWVALVNPGFPSGTADAFRLLDDSRKGGSGLSPESESPSPDRYIKALAGPPRNWPFLTIFFRY